MEWLRYEKSPSTDYFYQLLGKWKTPNNFKKGHDIKLLTTDKKMMKESEANLQNVG